MSTLILLRHGQSLWNAENRFTGFTDVDLSDRGRAEAWAAGEKMREMGLRFDAVFTSTLKRAYHTAEIALDASAPLNDHLRELGGADEPKWRITRHDDLRERDYGNLTGLNKDELRAKYGEDQVQIWRRSYDVAPPEGENLEQVAARVGPYFDTHILPLLEADKSILVAAHGNSIRALFVYLGINTPQDIYHCEVATGKLIFIQGHRGSWHKVEKD